MTLELCAFLDNVTSQGCSRAKLRNNKFCSTHSKQFARTGETWPIGSKRLRKCRLCKGINFGLRKVKYKDGFKLYRQCIDCQAANRKRNGKGKNNWRKYHNRLKEQPIISNVPFTEINLSLYLKRYKEVNNRLIQNEAFILNNAGAPICIMMPIEKYNRLLKDIGDETYPGQNES